MSFIMLGKYTFCHFLSELHKLCKCNAKTLKKC